MRVTIIVDDNVVIVEGQSEKVDCSGLVAKNIHAVQWYSTVGEVEYSSDLTTGDRKANDKITDISPFQSYIDAWTVAAQTPIVKPPLPVIDPVDAWDFVTLKIAFNHENRIRALEGKPAITVAQFKTALRNMANP